MRIAAADMPDLKLRQVKRFGDHRGAFCELYQAEECAKAGIEAQFVQDNYSSSAERGTLRGLHFQTPPFAQAKLVTVLQGAILDVAVDLRQTSPTYGHHVAIELNTDNGLQIFVPRGFAHGFVTLEPETHVLYKVDAYYAPGHDRGCRFDDPELAISLPIASKDVVLSDKDKNQPGLSDLPTYFD